MSERDVNILAEALHKFTEEKGLTQDNLAERIDKSKSTITDNFSGRRFASVSTIIDICNELYITPNDLLGAYLENADKEGEFAETVRLMSKLTEGEVNLLMVILEAIIKNRA